MENKKLPDYEVLHSLFSYDEKTGILERKLKKGNKKTCSFFNNANYLVVSVNGSAYMGHRLIYKMVHNSEPNIIDHINGNRQDNRACNLREASHVLNSKNQSIPKNNTSGRIGVYYHKKFDKWSAGITVNYKLINLGLFESKDDAIKARQDAELEYKFHENHGRNKVEIEKKIIEKKKRFKRNISIKQISSSKIKFVISINGIEKISGNLECMETGLSDNDFKEILAAQLKRM